jgi:hypothetical protein
MGFKPKRLFKRVKKGIAKVNSLLTIGDWKIKPKIILSQKDPNLQGGRRFFSRKKG